MQILEMGLKFHEGSWKVLNLIISSSEILLSIRR